MGTCDVCNRYCLGANSRGSIKSSVGGLAGGRRNVLFVEGGWVAWIKYIDMVAIGGSSSRFALPF